jgi:hypothetical protein
VLKLSTLLVSPPIEALPAEALAKAGVGGQESLRLLMLFLFDLNINKVQFYQIFGRMQNI